MELGLLDLFHKENILEPVMTELQLIGKDLLDHGKDGIFKDMDHIVISKVLNFLIFIG
jgi:hypothetical protein